MYKQIFCFTASLFFLLCLSVLVLAEESITITTYYPSPYGSYNELYVASKLGIGTTEPGAQLHVFKAITNDVVNSLAMFGYAGGITNRSIVVEQIGNVSTANQFIFLNGHLGSNSVTGTPTFTSVYAPTFGIESNDSNLNLVTAAPGTNVAAIRSLSIKSDGKVGIGTTNPQHKLDINGAMYERRYAASTSIDWNNSNVQSLTLSSGINALTFSNGQDGGKYILILKQPAGGAAGTVSWPASARWAGGTAPTLTTTNGKTDYIGFIYNGVDAKYDGVAQGLNF
jgi:hypothetical protein